MNVTKRKYKASQFCLMVESMVAVMTTDEDLDGPGPSAFWTWYRLKALQRGVQLMVEGLVVVGASDRNVHALSLVCGLNNGYKIFGNHIDQCAWFSEKQGRAKAASTTYLAEKCLPDEDIDTALGVVTTTVKDTIMPVMAQKAEGLVQGEKDVLARSLLENNPQWPKDPAVLIYPELKTNQTFAKELLATRSYHSPNALIDLLEMSGRRKDVPSLTFGDIADKCSRELVKFHSNKVMSCAEIDTGPIEEMIVFEDNWAQNLKKFHELKDILEVVARDMKDNDDCDDATKLKASQLVEDASVQARGMLHVWRSHNEYMMGHVKNCLPNLYPCNWLKSMTEEFNKDVVKAFINSEETSRIGKAAGCSWGYPEKLQEYSASQSFLCSWWSTTSEEEESKEGAFTQALASTRQARVALCGAKAAKLIFFKSTKMDKKAKRIAVGQIKEQIKTAKVEDIFPDALSKLLNGL